MLVVSIIFIILSALLHIYIWVLEQFLWDKPQGMKTFNLSPEFAKATKELAANQGLYNLLLAIIMLVGIIALTTDQSWGAALCFAGAGSTVIAGLFLLITSPTKAKPAIIQLTPGLIGCVLLSISLI